MFHDRVEAGRRLAAALSDLSAAAQPVVVGIPRGGVLVAREVAVACRAPLDVVLTHKLGAPDNAELAIGATVPDAQEGAAENELLSALADGPVGPRRALTSNLRPGSPLYIAVRDADQSLTPPCRRDRRLPAAA